jgi:hypothetical protein
MTEFETKAYGMSEQDIREQYMKSTTAEFSGLEMVVASILSDCQELIAMSDANADAVRKQMNVAKFILFEMANAKENA